MALLQHLRAGAALALLLLLTGCASREPLDYLPEGTGYVVVDMKQLREKSGSKRLFGILQKLGEGAVRSDTQADQLYFSFSGLGGLGPENNVYGVLVGPPGFAAQTLADLRASGGADAKLDGRPAVVGEKFSLSPVGDKAVLFFTSSLGLAQMVDTAKRKNPPAAGTPLFTRAQSLATSSGVSLAINAAFLVGSMRPQLSMLSLLNPKGAEALQQAKSLFVALEWDQHPRVEASLTLPPEGRQDVVNLFYSLLTRATGGAGERNGLNSEMKAVLRDLQLKAGPEGVDLRVQFPREASERLLERMEAMAENLPKDPKERAATLKSAFDGERQGPER